MNSLPRPLYSNFKIKIFINYYETSAGSY